MYSLKIKQSQRRKLKSWGRVEKLSIAEDTHKYTQTHKNHHCHHSPCQLPAKLCMWFICYVRVCMKSIMKFLAWEYLCLADIEMCRFDGYSQWAIKLHRNDGGWGGVGWKKRRKFHEAHEVKFIFSLESKTYHSFADEGTVLMIIDLL